MSLRTVAGSLVAGSVADDIARALVELTDELAHSGWLAQRLVVEDDGESPRYRQLDVKDDDLGLEP